jgi:hypothetical protein
MDLNTVVLASKEFEVGNWIYAGFTLEYLQNTGDITTTIDSRFREPLERASQASAAGRDAFVSLLDVQAKIYDKCALGFTP